MANKASVVSNGGGAGAKAPPRDRYAHLRATMGVELFDKVQAAKLLVVGAGGIGCELLKNLVLTGFKDIEVVDLDTIDVSNLNRQFLFRPEHVGQSKSKVAREVVLRFNPDASIVAHHGNIKAAQFGLSYIDQFDMVLNALDNLDARRHVNRLCLAKDKPLVESGTTGFLGQVCVIKKGETECYECTPKTTQKQYPICTIRATPDKPVHCIVWAKEAFKLFFGDMTTSMLYEDPAGLEQSVYMAEALQRPTGEGEEEGGSEEAVLDYAMKAIKGQCVAEISKKIAMDVYKGASSVPVPLTEDLIESAVRSFKEAPTRTQGGGWDRKVWDVQDSIRELTLCFVEVFTDPEQRKLVGSMEFDKDDSVAMRFVAAFTNLRSAIFHIPLQSFYEAKGIAGNIIPAIATTNAIIAGMQVVQAITILEAKAPIVECCKYVYCLRGPTRKGMFLQPATLRTPNPSCYVCNTTTLELFVDTHTTTLQTLVDNVFKARLGINEPNITIGTSGIYEEGEGCDESLHGNLPTLLKDLPAGGVIDGTQLNVEDFSQDLNVTVCVFHKVLDEKEVPEGFELAGNTDKKLQEDKATSEARSAAPASSSSSASTTAAATAVPPTAAGAAAAEASDDDIVMVTDSTTRKRKREQREEAQGQREAKKAAKGGDGEEQEVICID